ncbi:B12-binding domain-containing protein [Paenibacillus sp. YYML68]|uniref:cobalamin B12-binding domain-containing protein n=1 Tax=Paenibacillus sp. YYML68 TaxID=2909250 RepID=UPI0024922380|nr:cobalamin-dependent protein [Paenibacillus sp. YYML68]
MNFHAELLAEALLAGDYDKSWSIVDQQTSAGRNSLYIYSKLLTQAMRYIGELWEHNSISVADEHLASAGCDRLLTLYGHMQVQQMEHAKKVMLLCMEGELHYLGLKMISSFFQENGWETRCFGPNLPLEYALVHALSWKPDVIGISVTMVHALPKLKEYVHTLENMHHRPMVMIGGRLVGKYDLRPYCSSQTILLEDMNELHQWLEQDTMKTLYKSSKILGG